METKSGDCGAIRACVETQENVDGRSHDVGVGAGVVGAGVVGVGVVGVGVVGVGVVGVGVVGVVGVGVVGAVVEGSGVVEAGVVEAGVVEAGVVEAGVVEAGVVGAGFVGPDIGAVVVGAVVGVASPAAKGPAAPSLPPQPASRNGISVQALMTADRNRPAIEKPALHVRWVMRSWRSSIVGAGQGGRRRPIGVTVPGDRFVTVSTNADGLSRSHIWKRRRSA